VSVQNPILSDARLRAEIEHCESCETKPCKAACPADCSPADFLRAARIGEPSDFARAAAEILTMNPLGGVCGVLCPDRHCMAACSRAKFDRPVEIPSAQATIVAKVRALGVEPRLPAPPPNGRSVAVVGAGPAGLAAAAVLARKGYAATVFERTAQAGGCHHMVLRCGWAEPARTAEVSTPSIAGGAGGPYSAGMNVIKRAVRHARLSRMSGQTDDLPSPPFMVLFINSICYIHKFDGVRPLVRRGTPARDWAPYEAKIAKRITEPEKFLGGAFPAELLSKYKGHYEELFKLYQDNIELVYHEKHFVIDTDLQALGIKSNRQVATLEKLIGFLSDEQRAPAARKLLARYSSEQFTTAQQWQEWFAKNKDRIYFSDTAGFKFALIPDGYPAVKR
jgi:hypothetical protein